MLTQQETIIDVSGVLKDKPIAKIFPKCVDEARSWMAAIYPDVDFYNIYLIVLRHFGPQRLGASYSARHKDIIVTDCDLAFFSFYKMARKAIKGLSHVAVAPNWRDGDSYVGLNAEGQRKKLMTMLVHELTHHVQYERGFHEGNEVDTALNELYWLQENDHKAFQFCFEGVAPKIAPATIRRRRRGEALPSYLNNSGYNHAGYSG